MNTVWTLIGALAVLLPGALAAVLAWVATGSVVATVGAFAAGFAVLLKMVTGWEE